MLHEIENNEDTESFLKENGEKFNRQCVQVLQLLYRGQKLSAKDVNDILDIADGGRRLRDIFASRKDCKREWKKGTDGNRKCVTYWLEGINPPTKTAIIAKFHSATKDLKKVEDNLSVVFSLPDIPQDKIYQQQTLFS